MLRDKRNSLKPMMRMLGNSSFDKPFVGDNVYTYGIEKEHEPRVVTHEDVSSTSRDTT